MSEPLVIKIQAEDETRNGFDSAERTIRRNKKTVEDLQKKYQFLRETVNMNAQQIDLYKMKLAGATSAQIKSIRMLQEKTEAMRRNTQAQKGMNGQLRLMRGGLGQVGHQIQDVVVQAQMGQNAFLILGQQGSQIASLFGPRGALYGALLAIVAAFATFIQASSGGASSLKKLKEAGEELGTLFGGKLKNDVGGLADELRKVATNSKELALFQIALGKNKAFRQQADSANLLGSTIDKALGAIRVHGDDIGYLRIGAESLQYQFALTAEQAENFRSVLLGLKDNTQESRDSFLTFSRGVLESKDATKATSRDFDQLVSDLSEISQESVMATQRIKAFNEAQRQITGGFGPTEDEVRLSQKAHEVIDRAMEGNLSQLDLIKKKYEDNAAIVIAAMERVGASEAQQQRMRSQLQQKYQSDVDQVHRTRLEQFNKIHDERQKQADDTEKQAAREQAAIEKRGEQIVRMARGDLSALELVHAKHDEMLASVENLYSGEVQLAAKAAAEVIQIESQRSAAINKLADDERKKKVEGAAKIAELMRNDETKFMASLQNKQAMLEQALELEHITKAQFNEYEKQLQTELANHTLNEQLKVVGGLKHVEDSFTNASHAFITGAQNGTEAIQSFGRAIVDELIKSLVMMGVEKVKQALISKSIEASASTASVATNAVTMAAIAAQSAPAAAAVSLATSGGNAVPAIKGMTAAHGVSQALSLGAVSFEGGGFTGFGSRSGGLDGKGGFMAMLHPNETVTDHTQGGGGITIINNITAEGGGGDVDQKIAVAVTEASQATVASVQDMLRRGRM